MKTKNLMQWAEEIQKNISALVARTPAANVEQNVRALLMQGFSKLDLVTREDFDVQVALLERATVRLEQYAAQLTQLEARVHELEAAKAARKKSV
jgi:BMFP domain-containing protein YqiC